jgi:alkylhydroperoxidase family enzyme
MARIAYPDLADLSDETRDRLQRLGSLNVTRMMSHNEGAMVAYSRFGSQLLLRGALDPVLRELVILKIGRLCRSDYEWHQHCSVARAVGTGPDKLGALESGDLMALSEKEQLALRFAADIHRDGSASAATFASAQAHFSPSELVELALVAGFYIMTAGFLKSFDIEIEDTPPLGSSMPARRGGGASTPSTGG